MVPPFPQDLSRLGGFPVSTNSVFSLNLGREMGIIGLSLLDKGGPQ